MLSPHTPVVQLKAMPSFYHYEGHRAITIQLQKRYTRNEAGESVSPLR